MSRLVTWSSELEPGTPFLKIIIIIIMNFNPVKTAMYCKHKQMSLTSSSTHWSLCFHISLSSVNFDYAVWSGISHTFGQFTFRVVDFVP